MRPPHLLLLLLTRAAANDCAAAREGLIAWWNENYDLYTDDTARLTAYYSTPEHVTYAVARSSYWDALYACGRDHCDGFMEDNPDYYFAHNTCEEIQAQPEIAESCATWSGECNGGCIAELEAWYGCAFAPCGITCGYGQGKKKDEPDAASAAVLDFVAFFVLGSLALATLAGAACASGRAPYDIVGENLLVVLLAVFNLCGDAAMSILIKRKLNNTMWLVCVGVICAPLGVHVIAILDAWLYRADLSKLTKCNKAVVVLALFFSLPALDGLALALPWPDRAHEGFPTPRYSKASLIRAGQDAVMLLLKLVFYQAYAGFSALAMVLSVFSLVSLVFHARRARKIWPGIFVRNRNRNPVTTATGQHLEPAAIKTGPVVGSDSTTATSSAPEMIFGSRLPISAMKKLMAFRNGYFSKRRNGGKPFARAVVTYCFCNSSSILARSRRIIPAVPEVPMTTTGIHKCSRTETTLSQLQGWSIYSGSIRPPIDVPNTTLAKYNIINANRKFGVAKPKRPINVSP